MNSSIPVYIFVDVDDTIVRTAGSKRIPIPAVIQHVRILKAEGAVLYCWSSGGAEYARQSAEEFGLVDCFDGFLPKPNVLLDDLSLNSWPRFMTVHPVECSKRSLEDYRNDLE